MHFPDMRPLSIEPGVRAFPSNGTLRIASVAKGRDDGTYACRANNRNGQNAVGTAAVDVIGEEKMTDNLTNNQSTHFKFTML